MAKNFTVSNDSIASNPGNAILNPFIWIKHDAKRVLLLFALLAFSIVLLVIKSVWFGILAFILLAVNVFYWLRKKEHFKSGDSNGGLVVSVNPTLVAVATDLTKGFGDYPVIKILEFKTLKNVSIGERIATVALYKPSEDESLPHWLDFEPLPLSFATTNPLVIKSALDSYSLEHWANIEQKLTALQKPYSVGLYKSDIDQSDWPKA
ncbi:MAG: DUF3239 domain-containing protein [Bacteroidia bacterium]